VRLVEIEWRINASATFYQATKSRNAGGPNRSHKKPSSIRSLGASGPTYTHPRYTEEARLRAVTSLVHMSGKPFGMPVELASGRLAPGEYDRSPDSSASVGMSFAVPGSRR